MPELRGAARSPAKAASVAALLLSCATPALAQGATADTPTAAEEEIIVTGSRIKRAGFDTLQPAIVVDRALIENRAATNVADVLNQQPSFNTSGAASSGSQRDSSVGQNFVNFLGIGSQRTLTVVNGRRFPSTNSPALDGASPGLQVDLNKIPTALIERVEVIATGGAPIYGTDAIAGTVNVILRKRMTGFDGSVQAGVSERGDADRYNAQFVWGFDALAGRANIITALQYERAFGLRNTDREASSQAWFFATPVTGTSQFTNIMLPNQRINATNYSGIPLLSRTPSVFGGGVPVPGGGFYQFGPDGTIVPFSPGIRTGSPVFASGGDGLYLGEAEALSVNSERIIGTLLASYDVAKDTTIRVEGWYSRTSALELGQEPPANGAFFNSAQDTDVRAFNGPVPIRLDNPFLAPSARDIIAAALRGANNLDIDGNGVRETQGFFVDKVHADIYRGAAGQSTQDFMRLFASIEGKTSIFGRNFDYDVAVGYGRVTNRSRVLRLLTDRFAQAVDAVRGPGGTIVCRNPANGCAPLNILGRTVASDAARAFVTATSTNVSTLTQLLVSSNLSGSIAELPGGPLGIAIGAEYRREQSQFQPDFLSSSGIARGTPLVAVGGRFTTREVYGEFRAPLVSQAMDIGFVDRLEVEGAARLVDNNRSGLDVTWTAGARFGPFSGLEFRGNYTQSIRAPAITELFLPNAQVVTTAGDPCDRRFIGQGIAPTRRAANCAAAGITQPFNSIIADAGQITTRVGDPNLANEVARSWSVGAVIRPRALGGATLTVDWIDISLKGAISALDATTILTACYDSASFPNIDVCNRFGRSPTGQIVNLRSGYVNAGSLQFRGLTAELFVPVAIGSDRVNVNINYLYTGTNRLSVTGTDFFEAANTIGASRHRVVAGASWTSGPLTLFLQGQYLSAPKFNRADREFTRDVAGLSDWMVANASIAYDITKRVQLRLTVDNLFDAAAPLYSSVQPGRSYSTYYSGLVGRYATLSIRARF